MSGLAEEAPAAYNDVARMVDVVHKLGIGRKIASETGAGRRDQRIALLLR